MDDSIHHRSRAVLVTTCTVTATSFIFVVARLISRAQIRRTLGLDDWIISVAWIIAFGMAFAICGATRYGLGMHTDYIPTATEPMLRRFVYSSDVLYNPTMLATKTSILVQYSRLFSSSLVFTRFNYGVMILVVAGYCALTLINAFQCRPASAAFLPLQATESDEQCTSVLTIYLSSAPLNLITDVAILLLPMPIFKNLHMPRRQKVILAITFGFGLFVTIIDVVRVVYLQRAASDELSNSIKGANTNTGSKDSNFYWDAALSFMWSAVEANVGIMCACVPALKPMFVKLMPRLVNSLSEPTEITAPRNEMNPNESEKRNSSPSGPGEGYCRQDLEESDEMPLQHPRLSHHNTARSIRRQTKQSAVAIPHPSESVHLALTGPQKTLVDLTKREAIGPFLIFTFLFFIWGVEYGWLDILNQQFQNAAGMNSSQNAALHSAYYAGYFCGPLCIGYFSLRNWGFKPTALIGLAIYACGTLIFWPAAVLTSFPGCFVTNFIVGFGLSNLEASANVYILLCGNADYGATRLCCSQGFQAVGSVVASLIATSTFAKPSDIGVPSLVESQWVYLGMSFFTTLLAIVLFLIPLPEIGPDNPWSGNLESTSKRPRIPTPIVILALGVLTQFCYVGAQEVNATSFDSYVGITKPTLNMLGYTAVAHTAFAVARFLAAGLAIFLAPRILLLVFSVGALLFEILAISQHIPGNTSSIMMILVFFMEGPVFPLLFATVLQQMGGRPRLTAVAMASAISGGAVFPPIALAVQGSRSANVKHALFVAVGLFATSILFPCLVNFCAARTTRSNTIWQHSRSDRDGVSRRRSDEVVELEFAHKSWSRSDNPPPRIRREVTVECVEERVVGNTARPEPKF